MTTSPKELKELAEFAAEFLGFEKETNHEVNRDYWHKEKWIGEPLVDRWLDDYFFIAQKTAPILMHLGKREMEKRGFDWIGSRNYHSRPKNHDYFYEFAETHSPKCGEGSHPDNEFIAFWMAVRGAVKDAR